MLLVIIENTATLICMSSTSKIRCSMIRGEQSVWNSSDLFAHRYLRIGLYLTITDAVKIFRYYYICYCYFCYHYYHYCNYYYYCCCYNYNHYYYINIPQEIQILVNYTSIHHFTFNF